MLGHMLGHKVDSTVVPPLVTVLQKFEEFLSIRTENVSGPHGFVRRDPKTFYGNKFDLGNRSDSNRSISNPTHTGVILL